MVGSKTVSRRYRYRPSFQARTTRGTPAVRAGSKRELKTETNKTETNKTETASNTRPNRARLQWRATGLVGPERE